MPLPRPNVLDRISVEDRIREVRELMATGEWRSTLVPVLAAKWQLPEYEVRRASTEASRHLRMATESMDAARRAMDLRERAVEKAELVEDDAKAAALFLAIAESFERVAAKRPVVETTGENVPAKAGEERDPWE